MDQGKFQEAKQAYDAGDFRSAAKSFLAAAGRGSAGNGIAYHMAGNSLIKLRRYQDAVTVYGHALRDEMYDRRGAVHANVGQAYMAMGEYADAVKAFEAALAEPDYATPYKAWQGMASALLERNRIDEAAAAYRKAALDPENPDAGRALVNLGLCFMALGRPADAAEAYKAALGFDSYQGRGKALSNLGQAYVAMGDNEEAVRAFEKATQLHGHRLSAAAAGAYEKALEATQPKHEQVEGWETGDIGPVIRDEPSGWDSGEIRMLAPEAAAPAAPAAPADPLDALWGKAAEEAADASGFGDDEAVAEFFSRSEEDMRVADREARRAEASRRGGWKGTVVAIAIVLSVIALAVFAGWWFGLGWPTQSTTVTGLLSAYREGQPVEAYWVAVPENDVAREMAKIPPVSEYALGSVQRGRSHSVVSVTVTPSRGTPLRYKITLAREGVGWKVIGVENDWGSTDG